MAREAADRLPPDDAARLAEFARACRAAARVVALYPETHPAIQSSLARVAGAAEQLRDGRSASLTVLPDALLLAGRSAARPDPAAGELAALLHAHAIGEFRATAAMSPAAWHALMTLLATVPDEVRSAGGITRAWTATGHTGVELRQIDYAEVLRDGSSTQEAEWRRILQHYLAGDPAALDAKTMTALVALTADHAHFQQFIAEIVAHQERPDPSATSRRPDHVLSLLQALAAFVAREQPARLSEVLAGIAASVPHLTPEMMVKLITTGSSSAIPSPPGTPAADAAPPDTGRDAGEPTRARQGVDLAEEMRSRLSDKTVAEFVARAVARDSGATARLAQAFQALVPDGKRGEVLQLAAAQAAQLPVAEQPNFESLWQSASELLTNYSDETFVSADYGRELTLARGQALDLEAVSDDPPERISRWFATVSAGAVSQQSHRVLVDLLAIESRREAWLQLVSTAAATIDAAIVTGDLPTAQLLLDVVSASTDEGKPFRADAAAAVSQLSIGPVGQHIVSHIQQMPDAEVAKAAAFCRGLGPALLPRLIEVLTGEQVAGARRLSEVILSFGAEGHAYINALQSSSSPAARRTAIELLRAFGGAGALPGLAALLDDSEPLVQRQALRAIVDIGSAEAYATLQRALGSGTARARDSIMQALVTSSDERAAPLFMHILQHLDHRGRLEGLYVSVVEALGRSGGDTATVDALTRVLTRGEWWAPRRTRRLRDAAALALRSHPSPEAKRALEQAAAEGSSGVRRAARAALQAPVTTAPRRSQ